MLHQKHVYKELNVSLKKHVSLIKTKEYSFPEQNSHNYNIRINSDWSTGLRDLPNGKSKIDSNRINPVEK